MLWHNLERPVEVDTGELYDLLRLYAGFLAIGHDRWLASTVSRVETTIEVSELPAGLTRDEQLALFPGVQRDLKSFMPALKILGGPQAPPFGRGVFSDPKNRRILLVQSAQVTKNEDGSMAGYLDQAPPGRVWIEMRFEPADGRGGPGILNDFRMGLSGRITKNAIVVESVAGRISSGERLRALTEAVSFYQEFKAAVQSYSYHFPSKDQAEAELLHKTILEVTDRLAKEIRRDGPIFELRGRTDVFNRNTVVSNYTVLDLGMVAAWIRFGREIIDVPRTTPPDSKTSPPQADPAMQPEAPLAPGTYSDFVTRMKSEGKLPGDLKKPKWIRIEGVATRTGRLEWWWLADPSSPSEMWVFVRNPFELKQFPEGRPSTPIKVWVVPKEIETGTKKPKASPGTLEFLMTPAFLWSDPVTAKRTITLMVGVTRPRLVDPFSAMATEWEAIKKDPAGLPDGFDRYRGQTTTSGPGFRLELQLPQFGILQVPLDKIPTAGDWKKYLPTPTLSILISASQRTVTGEPFPRWLLNFSFL